MTPLFSRPRSGFGISSRAVRAGAAALLVAGGAAGLAAYRALRDLPDVAALRRTAPAQTSYMRVRGARGEVAAAAYRAGTLPLDSISPLLVCAVVKAEDKGFFAHGALDWAQVRRAVFRTLVGAPMGGSTITQQAARNLYLAPDPSFARKAREVAIAREMERTLPKRRILELYLNSVEWGDGVWGADQAAHRYLGAPAGQVDAFGAALLAAMLPAPRQPLAGANRVRAERVQRRVLNQLRDSDLLTERQWLEAQVRTDTLHARLRRGLPLGEAIPRGGVTTAVGGAPEDGAAAPLTTASALAGQCGLARELGER